MFARAALFAHIQQTLFNVETIEPRVGSSGRPMMKQIVLLLVTAGSLSFAPNPSHAQSLMSPCMRVCDPPASTTLADLLRPPLVANPFSTMRASLRRWSSEEFEDGVAYGGQSWLRRRPVDSFFPALLLRAGDAGGRRKRSSS